MTSGEFGLIGKYFDRSPLRTDVDLAVGDDCAILTPPTGNQLALSVDTLVSGVHFFPDVRPQRLGHKCLAVNLSDLAATGAEPLWCSLAITLPEANEAWLSAFSEGFLDLAREHRIDLVGGDTTQGPLSITVQVIGKVPKGEALLRSGAKVGDLIFVSGPIGNAGIGLLGRQANLDIADTSAYDALEIPEPRVNLGQSLRGTASACIDISDGLIQDLCHILKRSGVGAEVTYENIPFSDPTIEYVSRTGDLLFPLRSGDDYELCFTAPPGKRDIIESVFNQLGLGGACIGEILPIPELRIRHQGRILEYHETGYEHFKKA